MFIGSEYIRIPHVHEILLCENLGNHSVFLGGRAVRDLWVWWIHPYFLSCHLLPEALKMSLCPELGS